MALNEQGKRHIQSYGEQHPLFHSKEMKEYRKTAHAKSKALKAKQNEHPNPTIEQVKKMERARYKKLGKDYTPKAYNIQ